MFFFFKQKTAYDVRISDWSSDVCSSDLPPVAKFLDVGKFKYEAQKKANQARKTQKTQDIKEIKMRPNIDDHDYETKMKKVNEFIEKGDTDKITLSFIGRGIGRA